MTEAEAKAAAERHNREDAEKGVNRRTRWIAKEESPGSWALGLVPAPAEE